MPNYIRRLSQPRNAVPVYKGTSEEWQRAVGILVAHGREQQREELAQGNLQRCGGGYRLLRKRIGGE